MHNFKLNKRIISSFIFLIVASCTFSQTVDSLALEIDSTDVFFEKIRLDNSVAYRNESTGEIISQSEYTVLCEAGISEGDSSHDGHTHYDYWQCDKINPYKDVVLPTPFKIEFDQTTFTHPVDGKIVVTSRESQIRRLQ